MRRYLRLLPACLYVRLVRRHGERVTVKAWSTHGTGATSSFGSGDNRLQMW